MLIFLWFVCDNRFDGEVLLLLKDGNFSAKVYFEGFRDLSIRNSELDLQKCYLII